MPGNLLHENATVTCPHGGQARRLPARSGVRIAGMPVATLADVFTVTGCPYTVANKPQPCVTVSWSTHAAEVTVHGSPVLLQSSTAQCRSAEGLPQGPPTVSVVQQKGAGR